MKIIKDCIFLVGKWFIVCNIREIWGWGVRKIIKDIRNYISD